MRNRHRIATIAALTTVAAQSVSAQPLTLDRVVQSGAITGSTPSALLSSAVGIRFVHRTSLDTPRCASTNVTVLFCMNTSASFAVSACEVRLPDPRLVSPAVPVADTRIASSAAASPVHE